MFDNAHLDAFVVLELVTEVWPHYGQNQERYAHETVPTNLYTISTLFEETNLVFSTSTDPRSILRHNSATSMMMSSLMCMIESATRIMNNAGETYIIVCTNVMSTR